MARAPRREERTPEQMEAVRERFSNNPFVLEKNMTQEEKIYFARLRRAFQAAAQGDYGPGIAMGIFSEDAGSG